MKANELMVGDWVQTKFECPFKVLVLGCGSISDNFEEDVIPIPLTKDILKANGFLQKDLREFILKGMYDWIVSVYFGEYGMVFSISNQLAFLGINDCHICFQCNVHELQHALRLCGLADLADNFSITQSKEYCEGYVWADDNTPCVIKEE